MTKYIHNDNTVTKQPLVENSTQKTHNPYVSMSTLDQLNYLKKYMLIKFCCKVCPSRLKGTRDKLDTFAAGMMQSGLFH